MQRQLRVETAGGAYADLRAEFYQRLQGLYGAPGSDSALETAFNNFTDLVAGAGDQPGVDVRRAASCSAPRRCWRSTLNGMTTDIQALRGDAESGLADAVAAANNAMQKIAQINRQLAGVGATDARDAALLDQRDIYIDQLSRADGHPGRHRRPQPGQRSSPIPAFSSSARARRGCRSTPQGTVTRGDAVGRRSGARAISAR